MDLLRLTIYNSYPKTDKFYHCKNTIRGSVLHTNPSLKTTKSDSALHGKGINILREIAVGYHGEMDVNESGGMGGMIEIRLILQR